LDGTSTHANAGSNQFLMLAQVVLNRKILETQMNFQIDSRQFEQQTTQTAEKFTCSPKLFEFLD
jgi:hypothetical protein